MGLDVFVLVLVLLAIVLVASAVKVVPQGREFTVERFGRYIRTLGPGIAFIVPFVDRIGRRISMMESVLDVPRQEVITRDNASVTCDAVVFTQVINAAKAAYEVEDLKLAIINLSLTNLRTVIGSMELDEVLSQRDAINARLLSTIDAATTPWGVKVVRIEIKDLSPPADLTASMARQMKAERDRRAEITTAEGEKQAAILRAEGAKQAAILEAEGRKEAAFRDAEARERQAEAEANATRMVSEAIAKGDMGAVNYLVAEKYIGALGKFATANNQKVMIIPAEMGGLVGTLSGIAEIAKSALANEEKTNAPRRPVPDSGSRG